MDQYQLAEVILSREVITKRVSELAGRIAEDSNPRKELLVVGILTGAAPFMTDLIRALPESMDIRMDFMSLSSYSHSTQSSGVVRILHDLKTSIEGKDVLIVEDIIDTGLTLSYLLDLLQARRPAGLRTCVLLDKASRREKAVKVDYCGFEIPDAFVVGYGLDCAGRWRHLKDIWTVREVY